jgi:asparagine synthetase B (glutamine-hydrolysing)
MNLIYGALAADGAPMRRLHDTVTALHGAGSMPYPPSATGADLATGAAGIGDGGVVFGLAQEHGATLVLLGGLHHPLPDWTHERPGDDPQRAATWLLRRYLQHGDAFLDGVPGQFAVLIADPGRQRLVAACDGDGLRNLFVHRSGGSVAIASNLFVLARALSDRTAPDRSLEDFFLIYGYLPGNRTLFTNIETLRAGVVHTWNADVASARRIVAPAAWEQAFAVPDDAAAENDVIDVLYDAFMTATEEQTGSASDAAVLLGGVDSALVAAALHRLGKTVRTYSFHYEEPGYDQPHTDTLSRFLGSRHEWIRITPDVMREGLERYGLVFSRPTNWPNYVIQTARVCEVIREHGILHVHSGDGADHTFMGYPRTHAISRAYQYAPRLPQLLGRLLVRGAARVTLERLIGRPYRVGMNVLRNLSRPMPQRGFLNFRIFDESSLQRLRRDAPPMQERDVEGMLDALTAGLEHLSPARLAYAGKAGVSANKAKLGGSSDHTGVIIYAPYLHPGLKRLAESLPDRLLRPGSDRDTAVTGKYVLLKMAERKGMLPREVIYQRKVAAVDAPIDAWYAGPLRSDMIALLRHLPFRTDERYVETLLDGTWASRFYGRRLSSDRLTTHEASLLATYAALVRAVE